MNPDRAMSKRFKAACLSAAGLALGAVLTTTAAAQSADRTILGSTPLILKDGRIANVSVHVLPFRQGADDLAATTANQLAVLTRSVATDCFLTAQVIGHVGPAEVADSDTLTAHRLARSRADAVQAALIGGGLPAKAIASVWDWQFMVRESRATLWVFRLVEGEDCEGRPLDPDAAPVVAQTTPDRARGETAASASTPAGRRRMNELAGRAAERIADAGSSAAAASAAGSAPPTPSTTAVPAGPVRSEEAPQGSERTQPRPAASIEEPQRADTSKAAAPEPPPRAEARATQTARAEPERPAPDQGAPGSLVVTYANNSSYFPSGTREKLGALVASLRSGARYDVTLSVSVSGSTQVVGAKSADEAARYNEWLAKRRLERVRSWLDTHAENVDLAIETEFLADDDRRQVEVRIRPAA